MIIFKNITLTAILFTLLSGCSSVYKPTPSVLEQSSTMTEAEAMNVVKDALTVKRLKSGLCGGQGLPDGRTFDKRWGPNEENPDIVVSAEEISVNAYRDVISTSVSGSVMAPIASTTYKLEHPFRQSVKFADIEYIRMFHNVGLEYHVCYIREGQSGVMMGLFSSMSDFYGVTIEKSKLDRFIAAMIILAPQAELQTGS